jgi:hypothetical protein
MSGFSDMGHRAKRDVSSSTQPMSQPIKPGGPSFAVSSQRVGYSSYARTAFLFADQNHRTHPSQSSKLRWETSSRPLSMRNLRTRSVIEVQCDRQRQKKDIAAKPSVAGLAWTRRLFLRLFLRFFLSVSRLLLLLLLLLPIRFHRLGRVALRRVRAIRIALGNGRDGKRQAQNEKQRTAHDLHREFTGKQTLAGFYNEDRQPDKITP